MEKNIHDDPLDNYVRKSFEDYEDNPSDGMWARVSDALDEEDRKYPVPILMAWRKHLRRLGFVAAFLVLLATAFWLGHTYQPSSETSAGKNHATQITPPEIVGNQNNTTSAAAMDAPSPQNQAAGSKSGLLPASSIPNITSEVQQNTTQRNPGQTTQPSTPKTGTDQAVTVSHTPAVKISEIASPISAPTLSDGNPTSSAKKDSTTMAFPPLVTLCALLPTKPLAGLAHKDVLPNLPNAILPIKPQATSHWFIAWEVGRFQAQDRHHTANPSPMRHRFASKVEQPTPFTEWSLRLGKVYHQRWGWETGLSYRQMQRSSVHLPRFRFQDGILNANNQGYDFNYNLDTYGGTSEVTLRIEQLDASQMLPPTEAVSARIRTQETLQLLRVPMLLTYQVQKAKFTASAKGGLSMNYILDNKVAVLQRESTAARFRVGQYAARNKRLEQPLFMGYQVALGLGYRIAPRLMVLAEPTLHGDFKRKTNNATLPGIVTKGVALGIRMDF